jgi:hypothetical protein
MSVHHNSLGRVAVKCLLTKSAGALMRIRVEDSPRWMRQLTYAVLGHEGFSGELNANAVFRVCPPLAQLVRFLR